MSFYCNISLVIFTIYSQTLMNLSKKALIVIILRLLPFVIIGHIWASLCISAHISAEPSSTHYYKSQCCTFNEDCDMQQIQNPILPFYKVAYGSASVIGYVLRVSNYGWDFGVCWVVYSLVLKIQPEPSIADHILIKNWLCMLERCINNENQAQ